MEQQREKDEDEFFFVEEVADETFIEKDPHSGLVILPKLLAPSEIMEASVSAETMRCILQIYDEIIKVGKTTNARRFFLANGMQAAITLRNTGLPSTAFPLSDLGSWTHGRI